MSDLLDFNVYKNFSSGKIVFRMSESCARLLQFFVAKPMTVLQYEDETETKWRKLIYDSLMDVGINTGEPFVADRSPNQLREEIDNTFKKVTVSHLKTIIGRLAEVEKQVENLRQSECHSDAIHKVQGTHIEQLRKTVFPCWEDFTNDSAQIATGKRKSLKLSLV